MKIVKCDGVFKPFKLAPDVCDTCGQDKDSHPEKRVDMLPYKQAVWQVLLREGGTHNYYGSYGYESDKIRKHFEECGFDFLKMNTPNMDTVSEFAGTFTDSDEIPVVKGTMYCNCGKPPVQDEWRLSYNKGGVEWILRDVSLGYLIWQVVRAGEK